LAASGYECTFVYVDIYNCLKQSGSLYDLV
jgi:hypothetical protein